MKSIAIVNKEIQFPSDFIIVEEENYSEGIRFTLTDTDGIKDLTFYMQYENAEGQGEEAVLLDKYVHGSEIDLVWFPTSAFTNVAGRTSIQIYCLGTESKPNQRVRRWSTLIAKVTVKKNLNSEEVVPVTPTILEQYLAVFQGLRDQAHGYADATDAMRQEVIAVYEEIQNYIGQIFTEAKTFTIGDGRKTYIIEHGIDSPVLFVQVKAHVPGERLPHFEVTRVSDEIIQVDFATPLGVDKADVIIAYIEKAKLAEVDWQNVKDVPYMSEEDMEEYLNA